MDIEKFETEQTMTLKEITDLLEVRHNNAMAVVSKMLENQEFGDAAKIQYRTTQGNEYETYQLNKRQSIAVAARLNTALLMRIIDRWQELEARDNKPLLPQNYEEALEHLLIQVKENRLLVEENKQLETNLTDTQAVVDEYEDRLPDEWERNLRQVAKLIGVKPNKFNQCLIDCGYIYKNRVIYYWSYYMGQIKISKVSGAFKKRKEMNDKLKSIDASCPLCKGKDLILLPSPFDEYLLCKCNTCGNMFENGGIE